MSDSSGNTSEISKRHPSLKGVVGLQNLGNTCYANSTIQFLRAVPEITALILDDNLAKKIKDSESVPAKILLAFQDLVKSIWSAYRPAYVRPHGFLSEIRKCVKDTVYANFGHPIPNDCHEYVVYLLDNMHEALNVHYGKKREECVTEKGCDMGILSRNGWAEFKAMNDSPIVDMCFGMIRQTTTCTDCNSKSYQWQTFNVLKVPCEGTTFDEWIANEFKPDELDDYDCVSCRPTRRKAIITRCIWKLPDVLFISLRRFTFDMKKIRVACPYDGEQISFTPYFAVESDDESNKWKYELRAVIDHHGSHMGGHYTSQILHPISKEWWLFDDNTSHKLSSPVIRHPANYMYVLRRIEESGNGHQRFWA